MVHWIRRNPQTAGDCANNPNDPTCIAEAVPTHTIATATEPTQTVYTDSATPTQQTLEDGNGVRTTAIIMTNDDGTIYTTFSIISPTAVQTTSIASSAPSTTQAVVTDPPEAQVASGGNSNDSGMTKGAVAGLAIGTCIIGAAIAFIAAWLLFKRRDRKLVQKTCPSGYPIYADSSPELVMVQKSAAVGSPYVQVSQTQMRAPVPVPARMLASPGDALAGIVPAPASENEVQNRVAALFGHMQRHIDTFYRDVHASITPSMNSDLASFGKDVDMLELLQNCSQPTVALRHALVAFVLGITGPKQDGGEHTIWPAELTQALKLHTSDPPTLASALSLHRRLTIHIYTHLNSRPQSRLSNLSNLSLSRSTSSSIREAAEHFSLTFFPWADPSLSDSERESDLAGLLTEALEVRIWMAGQVAEWGFEWEEPGRGVVVVRPAVVVREEGGPWRGVVGQSVAAI